MHRRAFGQMLLAGTACTAFYPSPFSLAGQTRLGTPPKLSCMLWALEKLGTFEERLRLVSEAGYQGVELVGEFHRWDTAQRKQVLGQMQRLGLRVDAMSGIDAGFAVPDRTTAFLQQFAQQLDDAESLGCARIILLSGPRVPAISPADQNSTAIQNLRKAAGMAASRKMDIVIEPIDALENPTIFLQGVNEAFSIVQTVAAPNLKVLYDLYHEQRGRGNLLEKLDKNIHLVGLIHVADVPGRFQPGTGEIAYAAIYRRLAALQYDGWIAMEFYPQGSPVAILRQARLEVEAAYRA